MSFRAKHPKVFFFTLLFLAGTALAIAEGPQHIYSSLQKAFYLSQEEQVWIRPGLNITINNVTIPADRKPVVTFTLTDDNGLPLDREGNLTPGTVSTSFIMAYIPANAPQYVDYSTRKQTSPITGKSENQAGTDSGGKYAPLGDGTYTYTFGTTLPATYDTSATHTLGIYGNRNLEEFGLSLYKKDVTYDFVPNGAQVTKIRDVVTTSACNKCHDPLSAHGEGGRTDVPICILCHTPQTVDPDTGNTVDMKVMIHKIHMGGDLPSGEPYIIIGHNQTVADFSGVAFPTGDLRTCYMCHQAPAGEPPARQENNWMLNPTAATCGSCHDNVNFQSGENHPGGPQPNDTYCALCHWPQGEFEYDASVAGAHTVPYNSTQLPNPKFEILSITNTGPGQKPTVQFKITDKTGAPIAPSSMQRLTLRLAGPTSDYSWNLGETATGAAYANGTGTYNFSGAIPSDAKGTYALEIEGRIEVTLNPGTTKAFTYRDAGDNVVVPFAVTGTTVTPRRTVVDIANCNKCHDKLQLHGNNRNQVVACVICHNPTAVYPTTAGPTQETIDMRTMVHKIHTGEELQGDYVIGGTSFKEVLYPGDRRDCVKCHVDSTYTLPLPSGLSPVTTPQGLWSPTLPGAASCLSCHDGIEAGAHAFLNTATIADKQYESCSVCHKESADFAVTKVHAR